MKKLLLLLVTLGSLCSCTKDDEQAETIAMRINHFQNTGIGEAAMLTLLVQTGDAIAESGQLGQVGTESRHDAADHRTQGGGGVEHGGVTANIYRPILLRSDFGHQVKTGDGNSCAY